MFNITHLMRGIVCITAVLALSACSWIPIPEGLRKKETTRVIALKPEANCDLAVIDDTALAGAFLRRSQAAGYSYDTVFITGNSSTLGLSGKLSFDDRTGADDGDDTTKTTFEGAKKATATQRIGFGPDATLPNVYDISYTNKGIDFEGALVVGPGAIGTEIPSTGAATYIGQITIDVITQTKDGGTNRASGTGQFTMLAGYGSKRATFTASGFDTDTLPFEALTWSNLFMCGTRFVSSGKGSVQVQSGDGIGQPPFKTGREQSPFTAVFEASQFAPQERPAPPTSLGGVFSIESDIGTITGVFLSAQPGE